MEACSSLSKPDEKIMKSLHKNLLSLTSLQAINYLSPFIVLPYLSHTLSMSHFGLIMYILSIISIAAIITDFGFQIYSTNWIAKNKNNKSEVAKHIGSVLLLKTIISLMVICIINIFIFNVSMFNNTPIIEISILLSLIVFLQIYQSPWFFQGIEEMFNITICVSISKITYLGLIIILVNSTNSIVNVLISLLISTTLASAVSIYLIYKSNYEIKVPSVNILCDTFKKSIPFFISKAFVMIYTTANTFVVGSFSGTNQTALYSSSEKLYQASQGVTSPLSQVLFPYLSRTKDISIFIKYTLLLSIPVVIACLFSYIYSIEIITTIFGDDYSKASDTLKIFLLCTIISYFGVNFGYPAFSIIDDLKYPNISVIIGGIIQLLQVIVLVYFNMVSGENIALTILITESFVVTFRLFFFIKLYRKKNVKKNPENH
ncbi:oligosaccharide flippase family protein [Morganella morganii]|uniref:oligosaccharide flippase family protein n=2 Tax=Morganella morganii TaxID=582 RepID=UPI003EB8572D|nr:oligosaccharide flippase family protein [Morganella morganii]